MTYKHPQIQLARQSETKAYPRPFAWKFLDMKCRNTKYYQYHAFSPSVTWSFRGSEAQKYKSIAHIPLGLNCDIHHALCLCNIPEPLMSKTLGRSNLSILGIRNSDIRLKSEGTEGQQPASWGAPEPSQLLSGRENPSAGNTEGGQAGGMILGEGTL